MDQDGCPYRYYQNQDGQCIHYLFPPSFQTLLGSLFIAIIAGLSSMAGLGGGGPSLVMFIVFFNYLPKDANIVVFTSILGATLGNCLNQMTKAHNGQPIIQYKYAFVSLPIMFIGSFIGVYLNAFLPSLIICGIIVYQSATSLPKIYQRFKDSYEKETKQLILHKQRSNQRSSIIKQQYVNPFQSSQNMYIFKNILLLITIFTIFLCLRGSQKMPSIIGIQPCSFSYWMMLFLSFGVVIVFAYKNLQTLKVWMAPQQRLNEEIKQFENPVEKNIKDISYYSIMAGIFSGFGLGGGLFLVPMYRTVGCQPLEATASTAFTIVITSFINCVQGMILGVIKFSDFAYFLITAGGGSYIISVILSSYLRRKNRLSYVQGLLFILLVMAVINIPLSLLMKYINSGYDSSLILSFGSIC